MADAKGKRTRGSLMREGEKYLVERVAAFVTIVPSRNRRQAG
jgi:hypothetical protein